MDGAFHLFLFSVTYLQLFNELISRRPNIQPLNIIIDFEMAAIKAARQVWPNAKIQGCHFHLKKNMVHNLGQHGLKKRYEEDIQFAHEIKMLMSLGFLPVDEVITAFEYMERNCKLIGSNAQKKNADVKRYVTDYFANHYIGKIKRDGRRGKPRFELELWNVFDNTLNG